jgi:superfamily II DNA or RNA helicase
MKSKTVKNKYSPFPLFIDDRFTKSLTSRKEFQAYSITNEDYNTDNASLSNDKPFELSAYQKFIKAYMSSNTPYNSILLYHGLGTGKTCAAIGIAETDRLHTTKFGESAKIIIVASPSVQENFKLQLFDETKLKFVNGEWVFTGCVGNSIIQDINPTKIKNYPKDKIIQYITSIISSSYTFLGYIQFAYLTRELVLQDPINYTTLKKAFNGSTVIIDEYHNMKDSKDDKSGKVATEQFEMFVENTEDVRLVLLSATPIYNEDSEIIWTINMMLKNDKRPTISINDVFMASGNFTKNGQNILLEACRGYISFVAGDDPSRFPYKIYPSLYPEIYDTITTTSVFPQIQMNGKPILDEIPPNSTDHPKMTILNKLITVVTPDVAQSTIYKHIIANISAKGEDAISSGINPSISEPGPIQCLNVGYPMEDGIHVSQLYGAAGLRRVVSSVQTTFNTISYKYNNNHVGFFNPGTRTNPGPLKPYSCKIYNICCSIQQSVGISLVYSNYIHGGLVPMALALEEMGIQRYNGSLLETSAKKTGSYIMITGNPRYTPPQEVNEWIAIATSTANINGDKIKVILINIAGTEGIDLKYIRQVHIMEPWYNISRMEQIIGRAVRTYSHHDLPFNSRNVEIYLYGTILPDTDIEAVDIFRYRSAEDKAKKIGKVTRLLKQGAVDCILNKARQNLSHTSFAANGKGTVVQKTSTHHLIPNVFVGHMPFSSNCDFMEQCEYSCIPDDVITNTEDYGIDPVYIFLGIERLIINIASLYTESHFYTYDEIYDKLSIYGKYSKEQVYHALTQLISSKSPLVDKWGRIGVLVNIGDYYLFQPININDPSISFFDRTHKVPYKIPHMEIDVKAKHQKADVTAVDPIEIIKTIHEELTKIKSFSNVTERAQPNTLPNIRLYMYMGSAITLLTSILTQLNQPDPVDICNRLAISIYIDKLMYSSKLELIKSVLNGSFVNVNFNQYYTEYVVEYINANYILTHNGIKFVVLFEYNPAELSANRKVFILTSRTELLPITQNDDYDTMQIIEEGIYMKGSMVLAYLKKLTEIGFIDYIGDPPVFEFKIQDLMNIRSAGRNCDTLLVSNIHKYISPDIMSILNKTLSSGKKLPKGYLCMLALFLFRYQKKYISYETYQIIHDVETNVKKK